MVLEDLLVEKRKVIEKKAKTEKAVAKYLINLIQNNYNPFVSVFNEKIGRLFKENLIYMKKEINLKGYEVVKNKFFENGLYEEFEKSIKGLEVFGNSVQNSAMLSIDSLEFKKVYHTQIVLGWLVYSDFENKSIKLTAKGREIRNGYQKAQGYTEYTPVDKKGREIMFELENL